MTLKAIDPKLTALARRLSAKHGLRASDVYAFAEKLEKHGATIEEFEPSLDGLCGIAASSGLTLHETLGLAFEPEPEDGA